VVPRKHVEDVDGDSVGLDKSVNNAGRRAAALSPQRRNDLDALGMRRWRLGSLGGAGGRT
jgi:hypothetical protein